MKKIIASIFLTLISSVALSQQSAFDRQVSDNKAEFGGSLSRSPKIKADGMFYYLYGKINIPDKKNASFVANISASEENDAVSNALRRSNGLGETTDYFVVRLPKSFENYYYENAKVGSGFNLVGRYVENTEYKTIAGQSKQAPVFQAVYFELWDKKHPSKIANNTNKSNTYNTYEKCISDADGVMPEMIECSVDELSRQDSRLNAEYKSLMLRTSNKQELRERQRAWIKERDKECAIAEDSGQAGSLNSTECLLNKTKKRAAELEKQ